MGQALDEGLSLHSVGTHLQSAHAINAVYVQDGVLGSASAIKNKLSPGTKRNYFSELAQSGIIKQVEIVDRIAQYSFSQTKISAMTRRHTVDKGDRVYRWFVRMPFENRAFHDIHLKFTCKGIWSAAEASGLPVRDRSYDIPFHTYTFDKVKATVIIPHTDTVTVTLGCSEYPIAVDGVGVSVISSTLTRIEERLQARTSCWKGQNGSLILEIPSIWEWTVVLWHFGRDSICSYSGERFEIAWQDGAGVLSRIYVDEKRGRRLIRVEMQESPRKSLREAAREILGERHEP